MLHLSVSNAMALPSDPNFTGPHIPEPSHFAISQGFLCSKSSVIGLKLLILVCMFPALFHRDWQGTEDGRIVQVPLELRDKEGMGNPNCLFIT